MLPDAAPGAAAIYRKECRETVLDEYRMDASKLMAIQMTVEEWRAGQAAFRGAESRISWSGSNAASSASEIFIPSNSACSLNTSSTSW